MIRLGAQFTHTREMDIDDIFIARLKLLLIMGLRFLDGAAMGIHSRQAMLENACYIESEAIDLSEPQPSLACSRMDFGHMFYQNVKFLAFMITSIAKDNPMAQHQKMALERNIYTINETITKKSDIASMQSTQRDNIWSKHLILQQRTGS